VCFNRALSITLHHKLRWLTPLLGGDIVECSRLKSLFEPQHAENQSMRKDRLVLVLLLTMFALLGAECRSLGIKDEDHFERKLPSRALSASPLLRTYYDTLTTPAGMYDLKIPEDKDLISNDGPFSVGFQMGGSAVITDVRCRLRIAPPIGVEAANCEIQCRVIAPSGTASAWKAVDLSSDEILRTQAEVAFINEFDGLISDGDWRIELKDAVDDNDGRCAFRNATLRLNLGEAAPGGAANETQNLALTSASYSVIPELNGSRDKFDLGDFGASAPLSAQFTFATSFFVRSWSLSINLLGNEASNALEDVAIVLVSPSGGWHLFNLEDATVLTADIAATSQKITTADITFTTAAGVAEAFQMRGEPSAGTWTLLLFDKTKDGSLFSLHTAAGGGGTIVIPATPVSLTLTGVS